MKVLKTATCSISARKTVPSRYRFAQHRKKNMQGVDVPKYSGKEGSGISANEKVPVGYSFEQHRKIYGL